jgi:SAM-dependent methyltransferase
VLDLGCWEGHFLPTLAAGCRHVVGIDNDDASLVERIGAWTILESARALVRAESARFERIDLIRADGERLPLRGGSFGAVFCLDTLPYVPEARRPAVLAEIARVLEPSGTAVFSLPIEIGPALLVRELLRRLSGAWLDHYRSGELVRALLSRPRTRPRVGPVNLAGYDYREDRRAIAARFRVEKTLYLPWNAAAFAAPTVLYRCRRGLASCQAGTVSP